MTDASIADVAILRGSQVRPEGSREAPDGPALFELGHIIAELLDVPVEALADDAFLAAELDIDSLMDVTLVVEDAYGLTFEETELQRITCLGDIAGCLANHRRRARRANSGDRETGHDVGSMASRTAPAAAPP